MIAILDRYDGLESSRELVCRCFDDQLHRLREESERLSRAPVKAAEQIVSSDPTGAFAFDSTGGATITIGDEVWAAGLFECRTLGSLMEEAPRVESTARLRLFLLDGTSAITDIGALQATASEGTLFQVASQFNCLESPGPHLVAVDHYFLDPTQGPRASISALPGTLLRHYAAPDGKGGRFTQQEARQVNLLHRVAWESMAQVGQGYLRPASIPEPAAFADNLEDHFEEIEVGIHHGVQVVRGANWDGPVEGRRIISQAFTSTLAAGLYGRVNFESSDWGGICRQLLRAAYLGTLLGAVTGGCRRVVLTLIGGGVFGNPPEVIWDSILWACEEVTTRLKDDLTVVVNGRDLSRRMDLESLGFVVREMGGDVILCGNDGTRFLES